MQTSDSESIGQANLRVLVVEDNAAMQAFFSQCVANCERLELVETAGTVAQARQWMDAHAGELDILLTDLGLPDGSGLDVIRHALLRNPHCDPLVISMFGDDENILASIEAGALGYIHKDSAPQDIAQTILDMHAGASPISPMIARRVLSKYLQMSAKQTHAPDAPHTKTQLQHLSNALEPDVSGMEDKPFMPELTEREQEVLTLISRGFSYSEIAQMIHLSVHTVQSHIKKLYTKLRVNSKIEAISKARRVGLLEQFD